MYFSSLSTALDVKHHKIIRFLFYQEGFISTVESLVNRRHSVMFDE